MAIQNQNRTLSMPEEYFHNHQDQSIFWTAVTARDRITVIQDVENIIGKYGFITEFKEFSDLGINICIELGKNKLSELHQALKTALSINELQAISSEAPSELTVYLNISFLKGHGDLKIEVPAVPG